MQLLDTFKRKLLVRTCSVCGVEIDKTTAYTVSGEQNPKVAVVSIVLKVRHQKPKQLQQKK